MAAPGMSAGLSPAGADLGLGNTLKQQVASETEEERKKRMAQQQQQQLLGPGTSLAMPALFGMGSMSAGN